jgi:uncharacterized protein YggE
MTIEVNMKRTLSAILVAGVIFAVHPVPARSQKVSDRNLIFTNGTAEVTGQNDSAKIFIAVVTEDRKLERASAENAVKTKAVLTAVKGLTIKHLKLQTSNYRVTPQKDYKSRPPKIKGYEVENAVLVTMEGFEPGALSKYVSRVIEVSLENGANTIQQIQFYLKNKSMLEKQALQQATHEAIERAKILAEAAGVKLKRIASLRSQPAYTPPQPRMLGAAEMKSDALAAAPPMEMGESRIRVQVSIAYEIAP